MDINISPQEIAEQMAVCEAATKGPWTVSMYDGNVYSGAKHVFIGEAGIDGLNQDFEFITLARTAYPAALSEILRLQSELAQHRKDVVALVGEEKAYQEGHIPCDSDRVAEIAALRERVASLQAEGRDCNTCKKWKTMDCPNSAECYATTNRPFYAKRPEVPHA